MLLFGFIHNTNKGKMSVLLTPSFPDPLNEFQSVGYSPYRSYSISPDKPKFQVQE